MPIQGLIATSKLYGRGKSQVPSEVRKKMDLKDGDRIVWFEDSDGIIYIKKAVKARGYSKSRVG